MESTTRNYLEIAIKYHEAGYRVIPVTDEKRPAVNEWKSFTVQQTRQDIERIFHNDCFGIAMLMGNGIECIDIDLKYDITETLFADYVKCVESFESITIMDLFVQSTISNGFHLIYKCSEIEGNLKLASRPATPEELEEYNAKIDEFNQNKKPDQTEKRKKTDKYRLPQVLFETRGEGGYILVDPTPGYETNNGNIFDIPEITPVQRKVLLNAAISFNDVYKAENLSKTNRDQKKLPKAEDGKITPWDDYNERGDVESLLYRHGWTEIARINERIYYRRPGKKRGNSGDYNTRLKLFKTWSTSTELEECKAYSPTALLTELEHDGDFSAASKVLYRDNYGSRHEHKNILGLGSITTLTPEQKEEKEAAEKDLFEKFLESRFSVHKKPEKIDIVFKIHSEEKVYDVGGLGMLGLIVGKQKSGKSTTTSTAVSSALRNMLKPGSPPIMNMSIDIGDKAALFVDTEQSDFFYYKTQKKVLNMAGLYDDHDGYWAFCVKNYTVDERVMLIDKLIDYIPNLGLIVVDGALDICKNINNEDRAIEATEHFLRWRNQSGALVLGILHTGKSGQYTLGHLGSFLERKCDFAIEVIPYKDEGYSTVKSMHSRFGDFRGFDFEWDNNGIPRIRGSALNVMGQSDVGLGEQINDFPVPENNNQQMLGARKNSDDDNIPF